MKKDLPFDEKYFQKLKETGLELGVEEVFRKIHQENHWGDGESVSGQGSNSEQTATISILVPKLLKELNIATLLDAPCGDFGWIRKIDLPIKNYIGADIVPEVIVKHNAWFAGGEPKEGTQTTAGAKISPEGRDLEGLKRNFIVLDITRDDLPEADLILCRDCLVHLSFEDVQRFIQNIKKSKIKYLLTTTFPERTENQDIVTGDWRTLNLEISPFFFPKPLKIINENCTEGNGNYKDKSLGLWEIQNLRFKV
jgi:hypothetical protein